MFFNLFWFKLSKSVLKFLLVSIKTLNLKFAFLVFKASEYFWPFQNFHFLYIVCVLINKCVLRNVFLQRLKIDLTEHNINISLRYWLFQVINLSLCKFRLRIVNERNFFKHFKQEISEKKLVLQNLDFAM